MNSYPCELIEDLIPLYIEEDISDVTKKIVEEHLKECKSCSVLVQDYSNELNTEDLKEDLPQANTFRRWLKWLKVWGGVASILILIVIIATGVFGYKIGVKSKNNNLLTLKKIVKTFNANSLALKEDKSKSPDDYAINGVKPAIYSIVDNEDTLLIYIFNTFGEKKDVLSKTAKFNNPFSFVERPYHAKNALIVFKVSKTPKNQEELKSTGKVLNLISSVVFKNLNEGQERVYKGESESWEGTLTLKYYQHWFEEDGKLLYDSYYEKLHTLQYKKSDIENVGPITFRYEAGSSGGSSEGSTINDEGYVELGRSGGNGAILSEDAEVRFTVKWGDKEEYIMLKAQ